MVWGRPGWRATNTVSHGDNSLYFLRMRLFNSRRIRRISSLLEPSALPASNLRSSSSICWMSCSNGSDIWAIGNARSKGRPPGWESAKQYTDLDQSFQPGDAVADKTKWTRSAFRLARGRLVLENSHGP